jgi:hypothetical protein
LVEHDLDLRFGVEQFWFCFGLGLKRQFWCELKFRRWSVIGIKTAFSAPAKG